MNSYRVLVIVSYNSGGKNDSTRVTYYELEQYFSWKILPEDIYVVVRSHKTPPIKYEVDKDTGALMVDRFMLFDVLSV